MKPTIVTIEECYDGSFGRDGNNPCLRAGYKKTARCPSNGCQWSESIGKKLRRDFLNNYRGICCPACGRFLVVEKVPINEATKENEVKEGTETEEVETTVQA